MHFHERRRAHTETCTLLPATSYDYATPHFASNQESSPRRRPRQYCRSSPCAQCRPVKCSPFRQHRESSHKQTDCPPTIQPAEEARVVFMAPECCSRGQECRIELDELFCAKRARKRSEMREREGGNSQERSGRGMLCLQEVRGNVAANGAATSWHVSYEERDDSLNSSRVSTAVSWRAQNPCRSLPWSSDLLEPKMLFNCLPHDKQVVRHTRRIATSNRAKSASQGGTSKGNEGEETNIFIGESSSQSKLRYTPVLHGITPRGLSFTCFLSAKVIRKEAHNCM